MSAAIAETSSGANIWPVSMPAGAIAASKNGSGYTYYFDADLYSASIPAMLGKNVNSTNKTITPNALGVSDGSSSPSLNSGISRSFDRHVCWNDIERTAGVYTWTNLDAWVNAFYPVQDLLYVIFGTPGFYTTSTDNSQTSYSVNGGLGYLAYPDLNPAALGNFVTALMTRYGTKIKYIEIWNEPKYSSGNSSYFVGTPTQLAQIAKIVNQAAKAVTPSVKILSTSPTGLEATWVLNDNSGSDYLHKFLSASDGAAGTGATWVDHIAIHTYSHNNYNNQFSLITIASNVAAVLAANSMSGSTKVFVTETSAITPELATLTEGDQKRYTSQNLVLSFACGLSSVIWYGHGTLGFTTQTLKDHWNYMYNLLNNATIGVVNYNVTALNGTGKYDYQTSGKGTTQGVVYAVINGINYKF